MLVCLGEEPGQWTEANLNSFQKGIKTAFRAQGNSHALRPTGEFRDLGLSFSITSRSAFSAKGL